MIIVAFFYLSHKSKVFFCWPEKQVSQVLYVSVCHASRVVSYRGKDGFMFKLFCFALQMVLYIHPLSTSLSHIISFRLTFAGDGQVVPRLLPLFGCLCVFELVNTPYL